ncbi:MAG: hypothetical protein QOD32_2612 [Pyrinomonadaceae bacterium]|jgi:hypothetical protein|nr:hypothetical protein [Pyrinomonadaceae bacterium]
MKHTRTHARALARAFLAALLCLAALPPASRASAAPDKEKMKPEDVVAKHLESIGTAEARKAVRNIVASGTVVFSIRSGGKGQTGGASLIASEGQMNLVKMVFESSPTYPHELLSYDGKEFGAIHVRPGARSPLGEFLMSHDTVFKQGLVGGVLSTAWPLHNLSERNPKLDYEGTKKIGDRQTHELRYTPHKGSELKIKLFFDAETFQHVRTEYERTIAASLGGRISTGGASAGKNEVRYKLVEDFSDFKKEGDLTLPHSYKLTMNVQGPIIVLQDWVFELTQFAFNQPLNPKDFTPQG